MRYELEDKKHQFDKVRNDKMAEIMQLEKQFSEKITQLEKKIESQRSELEFKVLVKLFAYVVENHKKKLPTFCFSLEHGNAEEIEEIIERKRCH